MMTGFGMGFGLLGLVLMVLFWGGVIFGTLWLIKTLFQTGTQYPPLAQAEGPTSARMIIDQRYARGEITREQYEVLVEDLAD